MTPCFQARVDAMIGTRIPYCTGQAEVLLSAPGGPAQHAFCGPCSREFQRITDKIVVSPLPEGWVDPDPTPSVLEELTAPVAGMSGRRAQVGTCGAPMGRGSSCGQPATWMVTLDFGGIIGEAGACDDHILLTRQMANFITATPWVSPDGSDNPLQAKLRLNLMEAGEGVDPDVLDEAHAAIDAQNYQALDRALDAIERSKRVTHSG